MIDLFSLANIRSDESLVAVYRSHGLRLAARLLIASLFLVGPFFFLFDVHGLGWGAMILSWVVGILLFWLAFDVWSTSLVFVTNKRIIGAERIAWGRVRIRERHHREKEEEPRWMAWRLFPWLGTLFWEWSEGVPLTLSWMRPLPGKNAIEHLQDRRKQWVARIKKADAAFLDRLETVIDAQDRS